MSWSTAVLATTCRCSLRRRCSSSRSYPPRHDPRKVDEYKSHPDIHYVLLIDTDRARALLHFRDGEGWTSIPYDDIDGAIDFPRVGASLALRDIYGGLDLKPRRHGAASALPDMPPLASAAKAAHLRLERDCLAATAKRLLDILDPVTRLGTYWILVPGCFPIRVDRPWATSV